MLPRNRCLAAARSTSLPALVVVGADAVRIQSVSGLQLATIHASLLLEVLESSAAVGFVDDGDVSAVLARL